MYSRKNSSVISARIPKGYYHMLRAWSWERDITLNNLLNEIVADALDLKDIASDAADHGYTMEQTKEAMEKLNVFDNQEN